jgi:DNA-binding transcriptional LysR family regulator
MVLGNWQWDDVRFFLAVSREGSLSRAARVLGVDHVTVGRRIAGLEQQLGAKLLIRTPEGFAASAAGQAILRQCEAMEVAALELERLAAGHDAQFTGSIRLTTTEVLASHVIVPHLATLRERYPQLQVELITGIRSLDVARREADIALRLARPTAPSLVCRKLGELGFALYASPRYLAEHGSPQRGQGLAGHRLISYVGTPPSGFGPLFMGEALEGAQIALCSNSPYVQAKAAASGVGISELTCLIGDDYPGLIRVWPDEEPMLRSVWLITHEDLRRSAKIRVLSSIIADAFEREAKILHYGQRRPSRQQRHVSRANAPA